VLEAGDSGAWVYDSKTLEVYGHVVGKGVFGDILVMPMHATIKDIQMTLNARHVRLNESSVEKGHRIDLRLPWVQTPFGHNDISLTCDSQAFTLRASWGMVYIVSWILGSIAGFALLCWMCFWGGGFEPGEPILWLYVLQLATIAGLLFVIVPIGVRDLWMTPAQRHALGMEASIADWTNDKIAVTGNTNQAKETSRLQR
jgi:hypothetical protein